jgi:hypothetical protein
MSDTGPQLPAVLAPKSGEAADAVAWAVGAIAELCVLPQVGPDRAWAGRDEIIGKAMAERDMGRPAAEALVDAAAAEVWASSREAADQRDAQRVLMVHRVRLVRQLLLAELLKPREEVRYNFAEKKLYDQFGNETGTERDKNGNAVMISVPFRRKVETGLNLPAVRLLLECERFMADLLQLASPADLAEATEELEDEVDSSGGRRQTLRRSVTRTIGAKELRDLSPKGLAAVNEALERERTRQSSKGQAAESHADPGLDDDSE